MQWFLIQLVTHHREHEVRHKEVVVNLLEPESRSGITLTSNPPKNIGEKHAKNITHFAYKP